MVKNIQNNVDDCGEYYFPREKIAELLHTINTILYAKEHEYEYDCMTVSDDTESWEEVAQRLLPTQNGYFFRLSG